MADSEEKIEGELTMEEFIAQSHKDRSVEPAKPSRDGDDQLIAAELEKEEG